MVLTCDIEEDRCINDITIINILLFHHIKQIDSILPWVCTVMDLRCQNVARFSCLLFLVVPHFEVNHPLGHKCQKKQPTPPPPPNRSRLNRPSTKYRGMIGNLFSILTHLFIKGDKGLLGMDHSTVM